MTTARPALTDGTCTVTESHALHDEEGDDRYTP